jgi:nucleotide-binding universal stress UspA family protein
MKTILVATDFSEAAHNAALYGIELARAFDARLMLFNSYQPVPIVMDVAPVTAPWEMLSQMTNNNLQQEEAFINPGHEVPVLTGFDEALSAENAILQAAADIGAQLIIVGMKANHRGMRTLFGSTVTALAQKTTIPVLVVPENTVYHPIVNIALANESDLAPQADYASLNSIYDIATHFHSRLYLVRVAEREYRESCEVQRPPVQLSQALRSLHPLYQCMEGADVATALQQFIATRNIQLLAVMPHKLSRLERWFVRSVTRHIIFNINVPLLVLPNMM